MDDDDNQVAAGADSLKPFCQQGSLWIAIALPNDIWTVEGFGKFVSVFGPGAGVSLADMFDPGIGEFNVCFEVGTGKAMNHRSRLWLAPSFVEVSRRSRPKGFHRIIHRIRRLLGWVEE